LRWALPSACRPGAGACRLSALAAEMCSFYPEMLAFCFPPKVPYYGWKKRGRKPSRDLLTVTVWISMLEVLR